LTREIILLRSPAAAPENLMGAELTWELVIDYVVDWPVRNPKRRFDEYSSKFSLSYETEVYRSKRRKPNLRR
jgi:hypothetical protein